MKSRLKKAKKLLKSGDTQECKRLCNEVLLNFPQNSEALRLHKAAVSASNPNLAAVQEMQRLFDIWDKKAIKKGLEKLLRKFPDSDVVKNLAGAFLSRTGDHHGAAEFFLEAAGLAPTEIGYLKNAGIAFYRAKKNLNAMQVINRALELEPENSDLHAQLGDVNAALNYFDRSVNNYRRSLALNPANLTAHVGLLRAFKEQSNLPELHRCFDFAQSNLGVVPKLSFEYARCLSELGILDQAARLYAEVIDLDPLNIDSLNNLGVIQQKLGRTEEAIANFQRAVNVGASFPEAALNLMKALNKAKRPIDALRVSEDYMNEMSGPNGVAWRYERMGALYLVGRIEEARNGFLQLARQEPVMSNAAVMWQTLQAQLDDSTEAGGFREYLQSLSIRNQQQVASEPMIWIVRAIAFFIRGDKMQVNDCLGKFAKTRGLEQFEKLTDEEKTFCNTYDQYLKKLLVSMPSERAAVFQPLIHIGESHCLSYAGSVLFLNNVCYRVRPKIVFGIKAFHLSSKGENRYKTLMKHQLDSVPAGSTVLISIGEIDCRENEGLIPASRSRDIPRNDLIRTTLGGYVNWVKINTAERGISTVLQNIPAPVRNARLSPAEAETLIKTIEAFNATLTVEGRRAGIEILDVHSLTKNSTGFSNMRFHCDQRHLDHRIFEFLEPAIARHIGSAPGDGIYVDLNL